MGIDVYLRWPGMTDDEKEQQLTGWSVLHGHMGYLREAYHGAPYATRALVPEAFRAHDEPGPDDETDEEYDARTNVSIPAVVLRERLPAVLQIARERARKLYSLTEEESKDKVKSFADFVELAERKELEHGEPCRVYASF